MAWDRNPAAGARPAGLANAPLESLTMAVPKKAELILQLSGSSTAYITPPSSPSDPGRDAKMAGTVILRLPKRRRIGQLTVELSGVANLSLHRSGYESGKVMSETALLLENSVLVAGEHKFDFLLSVPATAAPFDKCPHGRVVQKVIARAEEGGWLGSTLEDDCTFDVVLTPPNGDPSLFFAQDLIHLDLGAYTYGFSSSAFCTGGLLSFSFNLQGPFMPVTIDHIEVSVVQQFTITSLSVRTPTADPLGPPSFETDVRPAVRYKTLRLDGNNFGKGLTYAHDPDEKKIQASDDGEYEAELVANGGAFGPRSTKRHGMARGPITAPSPKPLAHLEAGEPFNVFHTFRLPRCDVLRASVSPRTITPISKAHSLEAVITYRVPERPEAQKLVITRSVDVYSCHCLLSNLVLPGYAEQGPSAEAMLDRTEAHLVCADDIASKTLLYYERLCEKSHFSDPSIMVRRPPQRTKWEEQIAASEGTSS